MSNKKNKQQLLPGGPSNLLILSVIFLAGILLLVRLTDYTRPVQQLIYSEFLEKAQSGLVKEIVIADKEARGTLQDGTLFETTLANNTSDIDLLKKNSVKIALNPTRSGGWGWTGYLNILIPLFLLVNIGFIAWYFLRQSRSGGNANGNNNIFSMGKSRARLYMPSAIKENFESVAGAMEAKEELKDVVEFLKNPEKYSRLGAKITRGVLLVGEPGNGKTLLAKAVAGEANCPFFSISGSDFIEVFVGVGASRVRDMFAQARKYSPCIIFIDEIDAVGRQRGNGMSGGHEERDQTLNALLTEMDGFQTVGGSVIVIAATNRPDVLDKALLRPGRFDREVIVPFPDMQSREQILRLHAQQVKMADDVDFKKLSRGTPGFSGADLANLINEAALQASKNPNQEVVHEADLEEARDKIILGKKWQSKVMTDEDKRITAYHEAGHALVAVLKPDQTNPLHKVTILPRGNTLGVTAYLEEDKERFTDSKERNIARIQVAMGGRAAEELVFNIKGSGAHGDFKTATDIARQMVCFYGMSDELGPVIYSQAEGGYRYSQKTAEMIDNAVRTMLEQALQDTIQLLKDNRDKLETLAQALIEKETLDAKEVHALLGLEPQKSAQEGTSEQAGDQQFA